mmetsp:Transcript_69327/g.166209  ORF Transcript_69327/g.166209 Transcript_69327/m.166209 type:complete len:390 (+) Transcript_69327:114-1283(+)
MSDASVESSSPTCGTGLLHCASGLQSIWSLLRSRPKRRRRTSSQRPKPLQVKPCSPQSSAGDSPAVSCPSYGVPAAAGVDQPQQSGTEVEELQQKPTTAVQDCEHDTAANISPAGPEDLFGCCQLAHDFEAEEEINDTAEAEQTDQQGASSPEKSRQAASDGISRAKSPEPAMSGSPEGSSSSSGSPQFEMPSWAVRAASERDLLIAGEAAGLEFKQVAAEEEEESREDRTVVPLENLLPLVAEVQSQSVAVAPLSGHLVWAFFGKRHPLVREKEIDYIEVTLDSLQKDLDSYGNLPRYCTCRGFLKGRPAPQHEEDFLQAAIEDALRAHAKFAADEIFVDKQALISCGSKKVVKLALSYSCQDEEHIMTVSWPWDVDLLHGSPARCGA